MSFIRRVVTGHDAEGRAIVIADGMAPDLHTDPLRPGYRRTDLWKTSAMPVPIAACEVDPVSGPRDFVPPSGTKIRIVDVPPENEAIRTLTPEAARAVFRASGHEASSTFGEGARHPMMHRTESVDYAVVLEGEMTLVLDTGDVMLQAGDVVIQRGTNHAWSNRSGKRVRMLYVLVDGQYDADLATRFKRPNPGP